jgi:hypothetical protein
MNDLSESIGVEKIELMFKENISFFSAKKELFRKPWLEKFNIKNLYVISNFLLKKTYRLFPNLFKDIFFWGYVSHKTPSTKIFARTKYDEFRTKLDIQASSLVIKAFPQNHANKLQSTFSSGFYSTNVKNIATFNSLIDGVLNYSQSSHAGARPYLKDGKNRQIEGSFSAYYSFSKEDSEKITMLLDRSLGEDFNYHLSVLAGYKCSLIDASYSLGIVFGENSNSEMHQDTFSSIAKGFIYLQDTDENHSPFEYLAGSYLDAPFRSFQTNQAVLNDDTFASGSTRLREKVLDDSIHKYSLQTFTGSKGLFVLANTAGYHRKGVHNSAKPRITLNFEIKRKGIFGKFIRNLLSIIKLKISHVFS